MTAHHETRGPDDGAPVLFAGSLGTTLRMWDPQVEALSDTYKTVAYDQLGHGASPAPPGPYTIARLGEAAVALLDALGVERASFVGLSLGGMVGQWLAAHEPERVDRLVLLCTTAHAPPAQRWLDRARTVTEAGTVEAVAEPVAARWLTPGHAAEHPELAASLRAMLGAQPPAGYAACCAAIAAMDLREDLTSITAPTLVIGGAQDLAIPPEHQHHLATTIPGARLEILDPGAHLASVERADTVTRLIRDHLETR